MHEVFIPLLQVPAYGHQLRTGAVSHHVAGPIAFEINKILTPLSLSRVFMSHMPYEGQGLPLPEVVCIIYKCWGYVNAIWPLKNAMAIAMFGH